VSGGPILALDIGGTKLAAGVVTDTGALLASVREPTRLEDGPRRIVDRLVQLGREVADRAGLTIDALEAVGVGCGGPLDAERGIIHDPPNLPGWTDVPLGAWLTEALGLPVHLDNDANAAALAEHRWGAGRGCQSIVYLTISTGIGGGVVIEDRLLRGANGNAAEIGHMSVQIDGWPCVCGRRGCLEAFASGTNIARRAREALAAGEASVMEERAGSVGAVSARTVAEAARDGDAVARRVWDDTTRVLAEGLTNVLNIFNPSRIVLGGGVTMAGDLLFEPVRRLALSRTLGPQGAVAEIVPAALGEEIGVFGAAAVAMVRTGEAA
jgi:glucokinase